jgi:hypothetical protein
MSNEYILQPKHVTERKTNIETQIIAVRIMSCQFDIKLCSIFFLYLQAWINFYMFVCQDCHEGEKSDMVAGQVHQDCELFRELKPLQKLLIRCPHSSRLIASNWLLGKLCADTFVKYQNNFFFFISIFLNNFSKIWK